MTAELLDISIDEYFDLDAYSSTAAKTLIRQSPAHARAGYRKKPTKAMQRGDVMHKLLLGKGKDFVELDYDDYKKKAAQEERDEALAKGLVPILSHQLKSAREAAEVIRGELASRGIVLDGLSEQPITWVEPTEFGPVRCKAMFDHVWPDRGLILDIKTTENAALSAIERTAENLLYGIQAAAYSRALAALVPSHAGRIGFSFVFCETEDEPYAVNVCEPDGLFCRLGEQRWLRAVRTWAACIKANRWPSYGPAISTLSAPTWALAREGFMDDER